MRGKWVLTKEENKNSKGPRTPAGPFWEECSIIEKWFFWPGKNGYMYMYGWVNSFSFPVRAEGFLMCAAHRERRQGVSLCEWFASEESKQCIHYQNLGLGGISFLCWNPPGRLLWLRQLWRKEFISCNDAASLGLSKPIFESPLQPVSWHLPTPL